MKLINGMSIQRLSWYLALLILSAFAASGCSANGTSAKESLSRTKSATKLGSAGGTSKVSVQTTTVQRISIQRQVDLAGSLVSPDEAKVSSQVAGVVEQVLVQLGQQVKAGQVLVRLDTRELELSLQRAESQLRQTEAQLGMGAQMREPPPDEQIASVRLALANRDDALAQLRRAERLRSQNLLPQADLDTAETRVKVTEANYQAAIENVQSLRATLQDRRHAVELAQKKLNDANIRATVSGQVSERYVQQGEFIRENTAVVAIVQMNPLKIRTAVQERYAGLIRPGLPVSFHVEPFPDREFDGKVAYVSPAVDQATRTFAVEVLVDNKDRLLKPGFFAQGAIFTKRDDNVMAVSDGAISTLAGVSNVYVIENGLVRQQPVSLGVRVGRLYELVSGLEGNELLAASNLGLLATGVSVSVAQSNNADLPPDGTADSTLPTGAYREDQP